mgnify:FL=1|tara:strand:+ start:5377 stop:6126 length:750 start_codon:yes stop_codon:yes gene_type:complete
MSYVGIKKSYVAVIKQESTPPPKAEEGGSNTQIGVGNVFTTVDGKKRNIFGRNPQGGFNYNRRQRGVGLAGKVLGAGLGAWSAANTLSQGRGDLISDLGNAAVAGQQTNTVANAATNSLMDSGPVAGKPENFAPNLRVGVKNAYNNFKSTAPKPSTGKNIEAGLDGDGINVHGSTTTGFDRLKEASKVGVQSFNDSAKNSANETNQQYIRDKANAQVSADRQKTAIDAEAEKIKAANAVSSLNENSIYS